MIEKICPVCDFSFPTHNIDQQTCSKSCAGKLNAKKRNIITRFERVCPICGVSFITCQV